MSSIDQQQQRRIQSRFPTVGPRVFRSGDERRLGNLLNLTTEGLLLMCPEALPVGEEMDLRIRWEDAAGQAQTLDFQAQSRWCQMLGTPAFYIIGFAISKITTEELDRVLHLICTYGFEAED